MGLEPISRPVRQGARYVLHAVDRRGAEVKVSADAISGRVLSVRRLGYGEAPLAGPVYAERLYPPVYPGEASRPSGSYERPYRSEQQGNSARQPLRNPGEPSVIYAPRDNAAAQPAVRAPSAAKPSAPKVAAKPPAAEASSTAAKEATKSEEPETTGATPSPPPQDSRLAVPPVQPLE